MKMKNKKRILKTIIFTPFVVLIVTLIVLSIQYSPNYVYRLITMNVADVYDYKNFENHKIQKAKSTNKFISKPKEKYVESLFENLVTKTGFNSFEEWAIESQTTAIIVIQKDTIIYEKYFNGFSRDSYFHSQSMAKSFISFLVGAAIDDNLIKSIDDPITNYIPELLERDARFQKISIKHLLEMRSGLAYNTGLIPFTNIHSPWHDEAVGYYHPNVRKLLHENVELDFTIKKCTIERNVLGFTCIADWAFNYFEKQKFGHLVAISSIAGIRGNRQATSYNATKAYQINYLEGLRQKAKNLKMKIFVTDIRPGFVNTAMAKGEGLFWVSSVEKASKQICNAILKKKKIVYITKRWKLIAFILKKNSEFYFGKM
jgi:hypothetical protein